MIKRLLLIFEDLGQSIGDVAKVSGVTYDTLKQIKMGRVKHMRCDTLAAIITAYPKINANYILTGDGTPLLIDHSLTDEERGKYKAALAAIKKQAESGLETE